jgi:GT2 family glycosyltransferase
MAANGINAVRTYTVPPVWLLDLARDIGLRIMVGLPWEQHVAFLDDRGQARDIERRVREGVRSIGGHPAILAFVIGNEIPAPIVRWHGGRRIERFLRRLYLAAKEEDPGALVTYVNFPSTEHLDLSFVDFVCFNVYLENRERFESYLARLQNVAGDRPLLMAEIGLDSARNGEETQAGVLDWQVRASFEAGCAGVFVFAWTDEWHRGGFEIEDWDFGLTDRQRRPKPALAVMRKAFAEVPFPGNAPWPSISVVVCSHNGAHTIADCCEGLSGLDYPAHEVIVVDDGSTDATAAIARRYGFRVISTENRGLSAARNTGLRAAGGEIVAYTDDDARPDSDWLKYLASTFVRTSHAAVGGPSAAPPDGTIAHCVANSPGGPTHVLLSDDVAEHIPGCNMAIRRQALLEIGGFDERFRVAGDDVDVCWRLQERGSTIGFNPAAMVWHHRRNSIRSYWRQQKGYGVAEALLERKWPERYNLYGHATWGGRVYGKGVALPIPWGRSRVYGGRWGTALFQSVYQPSPGLLSSLPLMPEWYLILLTLAVLSAGGVLWKPLLLALPLLVLAAVGSVVQAILSARRGAISRRGRIGLLLLIGGLHLAQPAARLRGRLRHGLTPWRQRSWGKLSWPWPTELALWREHRQPTESLVRALELGMRDRGVPVLPGGEFDRWDLEARVGMFGSARMVMAVEEHSGGRQLARCRVWPRVPGYLRVVIPLAAGVAAGAALDRAWVACSVVAAVACALIAMGLYQLAAATGGARASFWAMREEPESQRQSATRPEGVRLPESGATQVAVTAWRPASGGKR